MTATSTIYLWVFMCLLRIIGIGTFFANPLLASFLNIFFDTVDGEIAYTHGISDEAYQIYDKIFDYAGYIAILIIGLKLPIKNFIKTAFIYRTIGQIMFFITQNKLSFLIFPNILEFPFITFLIFQKLGKTEDFMKCKYWIYGFWIIVKIWMEYSLHIDKFPWTDWSMGLFGLKVDWR